MRTDMIDGSSNEYRADVFRTRAVAPEVAAERGYRRYGDGLGLEPIFEADPRYAEGPFRWRDGRPGTLRGWVERQTKKGERSGWVMPKHALPGSSMYAPVAQLRPDDPIVKRRWTHSHAWEPEGVLVTHLASEKRRREHEAQGVATGSDVLHWHRDEAKYLLPPGPHGKRWDTHPRCTPDRFRAAERVFLHLEGTLKLDALVSAGEVGADVPSVTMWNRRPREGSLLDVPPYPAPPRGRSFWSDEMRAHFAEIERLVALQMADLRRFLDAYVQAPVIVVCDRDWRHNPQVALEAFSFRDSVRAAGLACVVAAPAGASRGSDDFQFRGGKPDNLVVAEPLPHKAPGRADFERAYRDARSRAGRSRRRRPSATLEGELALLDWYATHATCQGFVRRPVQRIAARLGVSPSTVRRYTLALHEQGALAIDGRYRRPGERRDDGHYPGSRQELPTVTIRLHKDLVAPLWEPTVDRWLRSLRCS